MDGIRTPVKVRMVIEKAMGRDPLNSGLPLNFERFSYDSFLWFALGYSQSRCGSGLGPNFLRFVPFVPFWSHIFKWWTPWEILSVLLYFGNRKWNCDDLKSRMQCCLRTVYGFALPRDNWNLLWPVPCCFAKGWFESLVACSVLLCQEIIEIFCGLFRSPSPIDDWSLLWPVLCCFAKR